jgi:hypothetical protein
MTHVFRVDMQGLCDGKSEICGIVLDGFLNLIDFEEVYYG